VIAPWREWNIVSREDAIEYARAHNVPIAQSTTKIYSRDRNIWHISHEGGALEDPANAAPDEIWMLTKSPAKRPTSPAEVTIGFEKGVPVSVDGKSMKAFELLETLNAIGGEHGIGRIDLVENRFVGMKSRGCYETPGGTLIMFAVRELEALTLDKNTLHYKQQRALDYAEMVYNGCGSRRCARRWTHSSRKSSESTTAKSSCGSTRATSSRCQPQVAEFAVLARYRQLHHGRQLRPEGRAGLHQPDRPADQSAGAGRRPK
jgi:argininosuccinate synthase